METFIQRGSKANIILPLDDPIKRLKKHHYGIEDFCNVKKKRPKKVIPIKILSPKQAALHRLPLENKTASHGLLQRYATAS